MCSVRQMTEETGQAATPAPKSKARLVVAAATTALVLAVAGVVAYFATSSSGIAVSGILELHHRDGLAGFCDRGMVGYEDITEGAQVVIADSSGKTLAIGSLEGGRRVASTACSFTFTIKGVPDGEAFYGISVAHRGAVQFTRADLDKPIRLSVG